VGELGVLFSLSLENPIHVCAERYGAGLASVICVISVIGVTDACVSTCARVLLFRVETRVEPKLLLIPMSYVHVSYDA